MFIISNFGPVFNLFVLQNLLNLTSEFLSNKLDLSTESSILLTVSGGIDSMVMADIFSKLNYKVLIAHCNFGLRGEESDGDELFVKEYAKAKSIELICKKFNTREYGTENGLSIQMSARKLRYDWFEEIRKERAFDYIAIAHNSDDVNETFFINLSRGTGLKGLCGIKAKTDRIIRPLIHASRANIVQHALYNKLSYREDSSNASINYKRNRVRHNILPEFQEINPSFSDTLGSTINRLNETYLLLEEYINSVKEKLFFEGDSYASVSVNDLAKLSPANTWLYELFKDYSVGHNQLDEIKKLLNAESGRKLITPSHIIIKDRGNLIITVNDKLVNRIITLDSIEDLLSFSDFACDIVNIEDFDMIKDCAIACIDLDKISFPLRIRSWQEGDLFYPLGMKGKKKISDFFTDKKIASSFKTKIKLLLSGDDICWVAGYRMDNRFKVSEETNKVLIIRINTGL